MLDRVLSRPCTGKTPPPENRRQKTHSKAASGSQQDPDRSPNNDRGLVQLKRYVTHPATTYESANKRHGHYANEYRSQGPRFGETSQDSPETERADDTGHQSASKEDG